MDAVRIEREQIARQRALAAAQIRHDSHLCTTGTHDWQVYSPRQEPLTAFSSDQAAFLRARRTAPTSDQGALMGAIGMAGGTGSRESVCSDTR